MSGDRPNLRQRFPIGWPQGAPKWAAPFILFAYLAAGVGILIAFLFDWWTFQIVVLTVGAVIAAATGHWVFAAFCLVGAVVGVIGMLAEARRERDERP